MGRHPLSQSMLIHTLKLVMLTIAGLWVERGTNEWFEIGCGEFNYRWTEFYLFTRGPTISVYFTGYLTSAWTRNFQLHTLEY